MSPLVIIAGGFASLAILSTWEKWESIKANGQLKIAVGIAYVVIILGGGYWYFSAGHSFEVPKFACLNLDARCSPPQPAAPIDTRIIVPADPSYLSQLAAVSAEGVEIYIGKWIRVSGSILTSGKNCDPGPECTLGANLSYPRGIHVTFDYDKWANIIATTPPGTVLNMLCQVKRLEPFEFYGENCEIVP